jgi:hypothetical protein
VKGPHLVTSNNEKQWTIYITHVAINIWPHDHTHQEGPMTIHTLASIIEKKAPWMCKPYCCTKEAPWACKPYYCTKEGMWPCKPYYCTKEAPWACKSYYI